MSDREKVLHVVYAALDDLNQQLPAEQALTKSPETRLYGREGPLDSLSLVHLVVGVEQRLQDELGVAVTIVDEKSMSQARSPFKTVNSFVDFIRGLLPSAASA